MNGIETKRFPEEIPISLNPEALHNLVQPVGEMVESVEAHSSRQGYGRRQDEKISLPNGEILRLEALSPCSQCLLSRSASASLSGWSGRFSSSWRLQSSLRAFPHATSRGTSSARSCGGSRP